MYLKFNGAKQIILDAQICEFVCFLAFGSNLKLYKPCG